jgi:fatty acid desaturase
VATLALYRAVLFIHEVAHLPASAVRRFETVWNLLAGLPLMVPSLMYVGSHADHHKRSTYGTRYDPEYEPIAHWSPLRIVASTLLMPLLPAALALRWGVIGPLSLLIPPLRVITVRYLSTLVIIAFYRRAPPRGRLARRWIAFELGAGLTCWLGVAALASGAIEPAWLARWYAAGSGILVLNHLRTLAAHRYQGRGDVVDATAQLLDSVNVSGIPLLTPLLAPVGLRYHGLHHLLPSLPYHSLGRLHRTLMAELPADSPYRRTAMGSVGGALLALLRAARENEQAGEDAAVQTAFRRGGVSAARVAARASRGSEPRAGSGAGAGVR